jgi:hypothetical protein
VAGTYVWELPDEQPGTLREIFAAEDGRQQGLVLDEIRTVDGFRRCGEAVSAALNPYDLILAVMTCIDQHLNPLERAADHRHEMRIVARGAEAAAKALEVLSSAIRPISRLGWSWRSKQADLPDPTDPRIIEDLRNMAAGLDGMLARGAFKQADGRPRMVAFERLIRDLARTYERATGRRARVTRGPGGYSGRFWNLVEILRPIAASIIERSGEGSLAQPTTELARGKFIERLTQGKPNRQNLHLKT